MIKFLYTCNTKSYANKRITLARAKKNWRWYRKYSMNNLLLDCWLVLFFPYIHSFIRYRSGRFMRTINCPLDFHNQWRENRPPPVVRCHFCIQHFAPCINCYFRIPNAMLWKFVFSIPFRRTQRR